MMRWLVLAVLVSSTTAHAASVACERPSIEVLPARGSIDVPINAKLWSLHVGKIVPMDVVTEHSLSLSPNTPYDIDNTSFTTGANTDTTPPATPTDVELRINTDSRGTTVTMHGRYSPDTAWLQLELLDRASTRWLALLPQSRFVCDSDFVLRADDVHVTVRAIDLAGNASEPVRLDVHVGSGPSEPNAHDLRREERIERDDLDEGLSGLTTFLLLSLGGLAMAGAYLLLDRRRRRWVVVPTALDEVSLTIAEEAIRLLRRRHLVEGGVASALTFAGFAVTGPLGLVPGIIAMGYAGQLIADTVALRNARSDRTMLVRVGAEMFLKGPWGQSQVRVPDKILIAAQRAAIPMASVERRD